MNWEKHQRKQQNEQVGFKQKKACVNHVPNRRYYPKYVLKILRVWKQMTGVKSEEMA